MSFYLLFPILGAVLGLFVLGGLGDEEPMFGQSLWLGWSLMIFGFLYFLGYDYFWGRDKLRIFLRVLGTILNVAFTAFTAFVVLGGAADHLNEFRCGFPDALKYGLIFAPIIFGLYRRFLYDLAYKHYWSDTVNLIVTIAFPFVCYIVAVALSLVSFLWAGLALAVVSYVAGIYYKGGLKGIKKFFVNFVFYLAFLIVGIMLGRRFSDYKFNVAIILGWIGIFCAFFHFLATDLLMRDCEMNTFFTWVGILTTAILGAVATGFTFAAAKHVGMDFGMRCGFKEAFKYALAFFPILFFLLRYPFYFMGLTHRWNSLMQFTVTLLFPVVCYVLSVIFLLVGFLWFFLAIVAFLAILAIPFATKRKEIVTVPEFIDNGDNDDYDPKDRKSDINGTYLEQFLNSVGDPYLESGYRWKPYTFNVSLIDGCRIYVSGTVYCLHKDLWISSSFVNPIKRELIRAVDDYRLKYNGPEFYLDFGGISFEKDPSYDAVGE